MKGPKGRLSHRVRRAWRCPACERAEFTGGDVVARQCDCLTQSDPPRRTWMLLVEEPGKRRALAAYLTPILGQLPSEPEA